MYIHVYMSDWIYTNLQIYSTQSTVSLPTLHSRLDLFLSSWEVQIHRCSLDVWEIVASVQWLVWTYDPWIMTLQYTSELRNPPQKMGKKRARIWQPDLTLILLYRESKVYRKIPKVHFHPRKTNHWLLAIFLVSTDRTKNEARTLFEKSRHMIFDSMDSSNFAMLFAKIWVVHVVYLYSFSRYT